MASYLSRKQRLLWGLWGDVGMIPHILLFGYIYTKYGITVALLGMGLVILYIFGLGWRESAAVHKKEAEKQARHRKAFQKH